MSDDDFAILDAKLDEVLRMLNECGKLIIALKFAPETNAKRIYDAASEIFALRRNIYTVRPDLTPNHLLDSIDATRPPPEIPDPRES